MCNDLDSIQYYTIHTQFSCSFGINGMKRMKKTKNEKLEINSVSLSVDGLFVMHNNAFCSIQIDSINKTPSVICNALTQSGLIIRESIAIDNS